MKLNIFCPNCSGVANKQELTALHSSAEFSCKKCNSVYSVTLIEGDEKQSQAHDGLKFDLNLDAEKLEPHDRNENLEPMWHCLLCKTLLGKKRGNDMNELTKCGKCGASYSIWFEV
jgi:DNA-directed RNA polymerase subunit M/transcription elongation factor TFIIS